MFLNCFFYLLYVRDVSQTKNFSERMIRDYPSGHEKRKKKSYVQDQQSGKLVLSLPPLLSKSGRKKI